MSSSGVYDFSGKQIYCFSDLEGRIPTAPDKVKVPNVARVLEIINYSTLDMNKDAVVFTGDLIDRGPQNIELMQKMLALKERAPGNVLLCMGNRDLNKIRLVDEYFIVNKDGKPCWMGSSAMNFKALCDTVARSFGEKDRYKFKYTSKELEGPMIGTTQTGWANFTTDFLEANIFKDDLVGRVTAVEEKTLGRSLHKNYAVGEFNSLFDAGAFKNDDSKNGVLHAAIAIMSMVMGCKWPGEYLPVFLEPYNGLYIRYLENSHVIGAFKAGEGKYGVASHAGLPSNQEGFLLTDTLMTMAPNGDAEESFAGAITAIEQEKNTILSNFEYKEGPFRSMEGVTKLIHLSICGGDINGYTSVLSPVTYMSKLSADGPKALATRNLGAPDPWKGGTKKVTFAKKGMIFYNIFGHQPTGYVPEVSIVKMGDMKGEVRNVCMDISKAESIGDANTESMAVLVLRGREGNNDILEGIVHTKDIVYNKGLYYYSKSFTDYDREQNNTSSGYYCGVQAYKQNKCTQTSLYGKVQLLPVNTKTEGTNMKTFYIPDKFLKIAQFMDPGLPLPAFYKYDKGTGKLIITCGDISGIDGFISVALYARTGADLIFIMNLPQSYDPSIARGEQPPYGLGFNYKKGNEGDATKIVKNCERLVKGIWNENKIRDGQRLYYVYKQKAIDNDDPKNYFYNTINPFSEDFLKVYDDGMDSQMVPSPEEAMLAVQTDGQANGKEKDSASQAIKEYTEIYMDMNGPCSFYDGENEISKFIMEKANVIKGLYIMGGVHALEPSTTMNKPDKINRVPLATMNQVYAPEKAGALMNLLSDRLHVVSNNEVVAHGSYTKLDFFNRYYEYFGPAMDNVMVQYFSGLPDVKLYDVMNSLVLIKDMFAGEKKSPQRGGAITDEISTYNVKTYTFGSVSNLESMIGFNNLKNITDAGYTKMYYDNKYGTTLLLKGEEKIETFEGRKNLLNILKDKYTNSDNPYPAIIAGINGNLNGPAKGGGLKYESRNLKELQKIAKGRGLSYSGLKKEDLIRALRLRTRSKAGGIKI